MFRCYQKPDNGKHFSYEIFVFFFRNFDRFLSLFLSAKPFFHSPLRESCDVWWSEKAACFTHKYLYILCNSREYSVRRHLVVSVACLLTVLIARLLSFNFHCQTASSYKAKFISLVREMSLFMDRYRAAYHLTALTDNHYNFNEFMTVPLIFPRKFSLYREWFAQSTRHLLTHRYDESYSY